MKPLFKPEALTYMIGVLVLFVAVKLFWFGVEIFWFPAGGINHTEEKRAKPLYYRVKLTQNEAPPPAAVKPKPRPAAGNIREITLLALYHASDIVVVTVKYKNRTKVLGKGESINGFVLEGAGADYAIFGKNGKTYRVPLAVPKTSRKNGLIEPVKPLVPKLSSRQNHVASPQGEIVDAGDRRIVDRSLLKHYTENIDDLYKNIGIQEVKKSGNLEGFRVTFIRRGSLFAKLGVKRGDVIKSINGQALTSYSAALNVYKDINNAQNITLVIERKNQEMELEYEIN